MTVNTDTGFHIPQNPDKFSFDAEVSSIFDNMASRSLPGYETAYRSITAITQRIDFNPGDQVWDFGVSTGRGLLAVQQGCREPLVDYFGCDVSQPMLDIAQDKCPWAQFMQCDFTERGGFPNVKIRNMRVAIWGWTLQFIKDIETRRRMLKHCYDRLEPGGVLFLMEKWAHAGVVSDVAEAPCNALQQSYLWWRRENQYTAGEIVAKSAALKNAMWPWSRAEAVDALRYAGFADGNISGLYQMFNFGGLVAVK